MECRHCEGEGHIEDTCGNCSGSGEGMYDGSRCSICRGSGVRYGECEHCNGSGEVEAVECAECSRVLDENQYKEFGTEEHDFCSIVCQLEWLAYEKRKSEERIAKAKERARIETLEAK